MRFLDFARDERGDMIKSVSLMAGAVAIAALAGTHLLDRAVQDGVFDAASSARFARSFAGLPRASAPPQTAMNQVTVDYTPTGSVPSNLAQPIILDPCTGARK